MTLVFFVVSSRGDPYPPPRVRRARGRVAVSLYYDALTQYSEQHSKRARFIQVHSLETRGSFSTIG